MAISRQTRLFWDIETVTNEEAIQFVELPKAPKNIKDQDKIAAAIQAKYEETLANAPLDADLCSIKSIAYAVGLKGDICVNIVNRKNSEKQVLADFWNVFLRCGGYSVGYNILGFDFPVVLRRSFELQVVPTMLPSMIRFRTDPTTDLMQVLNNWDWHNIKPLKWVCKRYGIEIPAGEEVNGAQVSQMSEKQLKIYAESDVHITRELYKLMNGYYFMH